MSYADFVHLRVHSAYSLSQGAIRVPELVSLAQDMQMPAVAITDSGNLFGSLEFSQYAAKAGVQPIIGCQVSLPARNSKPGAPPEPVVLLAQNQVGLSNLRILSSLGFQESDPLTPVVQMQALCEHSEGLIVLTGGTALGRLWRLICHPRI